MNRTKAFAAASCLGLATLAVMPSALADEWNKKTILTINEPIQVPGKVLQPGKYVMKLMDSPSDRHVVQIFNEREDQLQTTILAIPNYRLQPTGKTEFQWWEVPAGQPKAMRAWFYPGDNFGQEFAYPKDMSVTLASTNNTTVLTTSSSDMSAATVTSTNNSGEQAELNKDTYTRQDSTVQNTPAPAPVEIAQNTTPAAPIVSAPAAPEQPIQMARNTLPKTASPLPMVGLAGFLALGTSIVVRSLAKRA